MTRIPVRKLEIHAAHACNLTCESCSHMSNHGQAGVVDASELDRQMSLWTRLAPESFSVCGGEPTINSRLAVVVRAAHVHFPSAVIDVVTNGLYLHNHPELGPALAEVGGRLILSQHSDDPVYVEKFAQALKVAKGWAAAGTDVRFRGLESWTRRYAGWGNSLRPLGRGNPAASWSVCRARDCLQILDSKLWKCPLVAYLPSVVERFPEARPAWPEALAYKALEPGGSDDELQAFVQRKAEAACGSCPEVLEHFIPENVLISARALARRFG